MFLPALVLCRILTSPLANVFQKVLTRRGGHPLFIILATHAILTLACLPLLIAARPTHLGNAFWVSIAAVAALTVAGNALLVQAVKLTDLSVLGPINAYKPVISLLPALVLLGELPPPAALAGIGLILAGSCFLADRSRPSLLALFRDRGVQCRLASMTLAAVEAVFLKKALLASTPLLTFAVWATLGFAVAAASLPPLLGPRLLPQLRLARGHAPAHLALAASFGLMQLATILVLAGYPVGSALALFQTSALLNVLLGHHLFREPHPLRRLAACLVMVAGATLILLAR